MSYRMRRADWWVRGDTSACLWVVGDNASDPGQSEHAPQRPSQHRHSRGIPSGKGVGQADLGPSFLPSQVPAQNPKEGIGDGQVRAGGRNFSQLSRFCLQGLWVLSVAISALPLSHPQDPSHHQGFAPALAPSFLHHVPPPSQVSQTHPVMAPTSKSTSPILDPIWLPHRVCSP